MTETKREEYRKQIHGKEVVWHSNTWPEIGVECVLLWEPGGNSITVKEMIEPEVLYMLLQNEDFEISHLSMDDLEKTDSCMSSIIEPDMSNEKILKKIARLKEGDLFIFREIFGYVTGGNPSCAYA
jgi:hypothetical protein